MVGDNEVPIPEIIKAMHGELSKRDLAMIGFRPATKAAITRLIETSPALEEAILNVAELAFDDGSLTAEMNWRNTEGGV